MLPGDQTHLGRMMPSGDDVQQELASMQIRWALGLSSLERVVKVLEFKGGCFVAQLHSLGICSFRSGRGAVATES